MAGFAMGGNGGAIIKIRIWGFFFFFSLPAEGV